MLRRRLFHIGFLALVACSVVTGSFVARVAVQQALAVESQLKSGTTTTGNPLNILETAGSKAYTGKTKSTPKDLRLVLASVIKTAFQFIGIIMLCLMLYAGYLWMSARGDDSKVSEAKAVIRNAVIGMILLTMSYTLTAFIFHTVYTDAGTVRQCDAFDSWTPWANCENLPPAT